MASPCAGPEAEALLPKVDEAVRTIVCDKEYWQRTLGAAVTTAAALAVSLTEAEKQALDAYHAPLSFAAEGQPAQKAPNLRLTNIGAERGESTAPCEGAVLAPVCRQTSVRTFAALFVLLLLRGSPYKQSLPSRGAGARDLSGACVRRTSACAMRASTLRRACMRARAASTRGSAARPARRPHGEQGTKPCAAARRGAWQGKACSPPATHFNRTSPPATCCRYSLPLPARASSALTSSFELMLMSQAFKYSLCDWPSGSRATHGRADNWHRLTRATACSPAARRSAASG